MYPVIADRTSRIPEDDSRLHERGCSGSTRPRTLQIIPSSELLQVQHSSRRGGFCRFPRKSARFCRVFPLLLVDRRDAASDSFSRPVKPPARHPPCSVSLISSPGGSATRARPPPGIFEEYAANGAVRRSFASRPRSAAVLFFITSVRANRRVESDRPYAC